MPEQFQHMWVAISYQVLEVTPQQDGSLDVHTTDTTEQVAQEEALHGCWFCFEPLTTESYGTPCNADRIPQA